MQKKYIEDLILCHTYKKDPPDRPNGRAKELITKDQHQGPHGNQPEEGGARGAPPRFGRTQGSAEPRWVPVPIHFDMECPLLFLKTVAKVSIWRDGGKHPWRL
jgi:hypothetical protein